MALLRNGLSYSQASDNSSRKARMAYDKAKAAGMPEDAARSIYRKTYNDEMDWYEG